MDNISGNKRGISPLIATVLLIAFAVALGTVVMNIGQETINSVPNYTAKCEETFIEFLVFPDSTPDVCQADEEVRVAIKSFNSKVDGVKVNINSERGSDSFDQFFNKQLKDGSNEKVIRPFSKGNKGKVTIIEVIPILGNEKNPAYCQSNIIKLSDIKVC
jgi:flagellin-like protein